MPTMFTSHTARQARRLRSRDSVLSSTLKKISVEPGAILGLFFLIMVLTAFFWPTLVGRADFYLSDISYYFQPFCTFMRHSCQDGRFPLWNPYMYCGMSQVAVPSPGLFYPPTWLLVWAPFSCGLALYMMLHQLIAAVGAWLLVCDCGRGKVAAAVASSICALGGYMFALSSNFTLMASAAWIPMCICIVLRIDEEFALFNICQVALASISVALMVAAGRPEVGAPAMILLGFCAVWPLVGAWRSREVEKKTAVKKFLLRALPLVFAIGLTTPVTLPALEWARVSPRSHGMETQFVFTWSTNWYDFLGLVLNNPMGDLLELPNKYRNLVTSRVGYLPFLSSAYVGPVALTLAFWGMFDNKWRERWFALFLFCGFCLMAAGNYTPFAPALVKASSILTAFRYPVKLIIFPVMFMGLSASAGAQLLMDKKLPKAPIIVMSLIWVATLLVGLAMIFCPGLWFIFGPWKQPALINESQVLFGWSMVKAALIALGFCSVALGYASYKLPRVYCATLMLVLLVVPLLVSAYQFCRHWAPVVESESSKGLVQTGYFEFKSPVAEKLRDELGENRRFLSLYFDPLVVPPWCQYSKAWSHDEKFYEYARQLLLPNTHVAQRVRHANGYEAAETTEYKQFFKAAYATCSQNHKAKDKVTDLGIARFCSLTATNIVVTQLFERAPTEAAKPPLTAQLDARYFVLRSDDRLDNVRFYDVLNAAPRCRFARQVQVVPNVDQARTEILTGKIADNTLPYLAVFAENDCKTMSESIRKRLSEIPDLPAIGSPKYKAEASKYADLYDASADLQLDRDAELTIKTRNLQPGILLLSDHCYPGWKARVDGHDAAIMRANVFCRAVEVPAGEHTVSFSYQPQSLQAGGIVASSTIAIIGLLLGLAAVKKRADQPE